MDVWKIPQEEPAAPKPGWLRYALSALAVAGVTLALFLLLTAGHANRPKAVIQLSDQLNTALAQVVAVRSPALAEDGRAQLLYQKQLEAMALREVLGPMDRQETALFALLNGRLDSAQGSLQISAVADLEIAAQIARLRLDYGLAVQLLDRAAQQNPDRASTLLPLLADTLTEQGLVGGHASPLRDAVALYRDTLLPNAPDDPTRAVLYNNLGIALQGLGRVSGDAISLEDAAIAFRDGLNIMSRGADPVQAAATQTNLAAVLYDLAVLEPSLPLLQAAEAALRDAMVIGPEASMPLYQRQLAAVLLLQVNDNGAHLRLDEVAPLLEAGYAPGTPESAASARASIYLEYGDALAAAGESDADPALLQRAVVAYGTALELVDQRNRPMVWAAVQANLGTVQAGIAAMQSSTPAYESAVTAFKAALSIYTAQNADIDWALTQNNLGLTLEGQAARIGDTNLLNEAMRRYAAALEKLSGVDEALAAQVRYNLSMAEVRTVELQLRMSSGN